MPDSLANKHVVSTSLVRFNILTILAGLSFQNTAAKITEAHSVAAVVNGISLMMMLSNFYHGKVSTTESPEHISLLRGNPRHALLDYALNILVITAFVFMPYYLAQPIRYLEANIVLRALDWLLVVFMAFYLHRDAPRLIYRAQKYWLWFNVTAVSFYSILIWAIATWRLDPLIVSIIVLVHICLDMCIDYSRNSELYFGKTAK